jgi:1,2-diacylglycerol 3-alpha-glucosyltransferase
VSHAAGAGGGPRVLVACSGVGHVLRGYETASAELVHALRDTIRMTLVRGGGPWLGGTGARLPCLQRYGRGAGALGLSGARAYLVEQRTFAPGVYALARLGGFDVVHLHDPGLMNVVWHARRRFGGRFAIVFTNGGPLSPEHLGRPDLIQSVTPVDAARLYEAGFPPWRVAMVPHGSRRVSAASRAFVGDSPKVLLGVGTLNDSHKGFATAIRAAAVIPDATLRLLGQRDEETAGVEALGGALLGARFSTATLPADEVPAALAEADALVLPTHNEGFCLAVLEAMAAGLPCVVSDIPVLRWLVGEAGVLVPPDRPELWAAAIQGLTAERRRALSERGRRRAGEFFWERLIGDHIAMYDKALLARQMRAAGS